MGVVTVGATVGDALTRIGLITWLTQPNALVTVYTIVSAPGLMPLTSPPVVTVAMLVLVLDHVPPVALFVKPEGYPIQTMLLPLIDDIVGNGFTVIDFDTDTTQGMIL